MFNGVKEFEDTTFEDQFQELVDKTNRKKEESKRMGKAKKVEEEKKQENDLTGKNWTHEDIQNLTKAIVKFQAGTVDRWRVIG